MPKAETPSRQPLAQKGYCVTDWLRKNLEQVFKLSPGAVDWLVLVYDVIQVFDDVADGDKVERQHLDAAIWNCLVGLHQNPFFQSHSSTLTPLLATMILKWQASDQEEREGNADAMCFAWRAGYYDLILGAIMIEHGPSYAQQSAPLVMRLYGEKYEEYLKEFNHA